MQGKDVNLLAVDIGNTHTVFGLINGSEIKAQWRIRTDRDATADELAINVGALLKYNKIEFPELTDCIISSVVPPALENWKAFISHYTGRPLLSVNEHLQEIMDIRYSRPYEVGADRIVNSVAAWETFRTALILVDFGTAITFDCVSEKREYLGGVIAPGPKLAAQGLASGTSKLPIVDLSIPEGGVIAQDTVSAIQAGLIYGFAGLTDRIIEQLMKEFPAAPKCIATGGLSHLIIPYCKNIDHIEPNLTLQGLEVIYNNYLKKK